MSRIKILPEVLSNKIAAGEVVERPASVVKELVENAIDAESTKVVVEIKKGGRALIRVSDNGIGMDRDNALLSIERYATSKIYDEESLFSIATLGFRGEALPSIASVSDMEMVTRVASSDVGTRVIVEGGKIKTVAEIGAPKGTMVSVNRLFFNTPARRKYLKTEQTEMGHISDTVTRMALAWPGIHFKFLHNGRVLGNWGPTSNPLHRIVDVLGGDLVDRLYEVDHKGGNVRVHGFVASPNITRTTSRGLYVYVNGRFVRDKMLDHAIREGYAGHLMKGKFPVVVLFVTLPYDQVDVNVHPTKSSVRFEAPRQVYDTVSKGVTATLQALNRLKWGHTPLPKPVRPRRYTISPPYGKISEPTAKPLPVSDSRPLDDTPRLWPERSFASLRVIGQLYNTYIVCESEDGLVLIDQHAAHERVVFESLKAAYSDSDVASQGLLIPERLELSHREASILDTLLKDLGNIGLEIEPFGGRTYLVKAVPDILAGKPMKPLVLEIIEKVAEIGLATGLHRAVDECLTIMACHGAIRANEKLSDEEMSTLLKQLDTLQHATHCPHGRPVLVHRSLRQIEKDFKRIV
ncbi:MAG: DNA mismatch repair endonuclease MutL [Deltaproteobacteria bacterium]|nr:DNA mismatch repair endonuclease MutL [Deltaproteobacteria bacterium]MBW2018766.1 DNA mismatch repair endonuclease MutL [Deltaproteobacteria bacterium]MBW2073495.1 DNA mismatch repair endonuclease MutL [Deltaproteobacteria bacterium]RLB83001.1 MAG: DNA mismatch repair endonuclease MutL [Deltaproteobacteria bacterium]